MNSKEGERWLDELALYFARRDTGEEDRAFWSNIYNAASARNIRARLSAAEAEIERLKDFAEAVKRNSDPTLGRTFDELISAMGHVNDLARAALSKEKE